MKDTDPFDGEGLPDPGGLNIDYQETAPFEPTEDEVKMLQSDFKTIADSVRTNLTNDFTVSSRIDRTREGPQGHVIVELPSGDVIGPGMSITADRFDGASNSDWSGPIPPDEIETLSREITMITVIQWAQLLDEIGGGQALPAS